MTRIEHTAQLTCHPESESPAIRGIEARIARLDACTLIFHYLAKLDTSRIRIPKPRRPRRAEDLWRHTCFEAFVATDQDSRYCELNFSPSGEWAAYYFHRYREGGPLETDPIGGEIVIRTTNDSLSLNAKVRLQALPLLLRNAVRLGLAAVIEGESGMLSYWALKHPPGRPDFHHNLGFALDLGWPAENLDP